MPSSTSRATGGERNSTCAASRFSVAQLLGCSYRARGGRVTHVIVEVQRCRLNGVCRSHRSADGQPPLPWGAPTDQIQSHTPARRLQLAGHTGKQVLDTIGYTYKSISSKDTLAFDIGLVRHRSAFVCCGFVFVCVFVCVPIARTM